MLKYPLTKLMVYARRISTAAGKKTLSSIAMNLRDLNLHGPTPTLWKLHARCAQKPFAFIARDHSLLHQNFEYQNLCCIYEVRHRQLVLISNNFKRPSESMSRSANLAVAA